MTIDLHNAPLWQTIRSVDPEVWATEIAKLAGDTQVTQERLAKWFSEYKTAVENRDIAALGYVSGVMADNSGAWDGKAPWWFPEPPEWLDLWYKGQAVADEDVADTLDA
jgi:hypothetical protein